MAPVRRLNTVVLPAPFGPTRAVIVPSTELDVQVVGGDDAAEALADTVGLEHDRRVVPRPLAIGSPSAASAAVG